MMMGLHSVASPTRRGFTLTELAIVLGIMGTILGAIWIAAARVYTNNKAQKAAGQVQVILSGYRRLYAQHAVDTGGASGAPLWNDITCMGMNAGFFPNEMMPAAYTCSGDPPTPSAYPSTPWGSGSWVKVRGDQANNGIMISYFGISQSACLALAMSEANAPDLIASWVGLSPSPHPASYPTSGPMSLTTINTYCADSATNDEVTFEYKAR
jgi:prepilin-type N-terminal cleavage/methylation domain-containing protein